MMPVRHLYIHVPFCGRRCVYCDFSIAVRKPVPVAEYVSAIDREWQARHRGSDLRLESMYFGGGTPSRLGADGVRRLLDVVTARAQLLPGAEVTLEANPEDVTADAASAWLAAGITRVSLGVQSFDDATLAWMHRSHDAMAATRAVQLLREAGLANVSIDLIFAVPTALRRSWERDLDAALALELPHVSVYGLTVEPATPLARWVASARFREAPEENFERQFLLAHRQLTASGLEHYEVSNFGRSQYQSVHNWAYWRRHQYAGIGPSAHEFDGFTRQWNIEAYAEWLQCTSEPDAATTAGSETLTPAQVTAEEMYLSLRTSMGLSVTDDERTHVASWVERGWATLQADTVKLTAKGWLRLDALANDLTLFRSRL